jgi:hypothetical protein
MPSLPELQQQFLHFLTGRDGQLAHAVAQQGPVDVNTRLDIYRNAYQLRLRGVLETDHEMLWSYLGDELFDNMCRAYIQQHPSAFTSLRHYADALPGFLRTTEPFSQIPVISEIARFERQLLDVFDASDAASAHIDALLQIAPEHWPAMVFRFHPSTQLFMAHCNSVAIWKALKSGAVPPLAACSADEPWLLWRSSQLLTEFRPLDETEYVLLIAALRGESFAGLCELMAQSHAVDEVGQLNLQRVLRWIESGMIQSIDIL